MNKGRITGRILMLLGVLCILGAGGLALYNGYTENRAAELSFEVLVRLDMDNVVTERHDENTPADYVINPDMDMPKKEVDGNKYVGAVTVPALDIELPVMAEWSYDNFKISPCVYEGTPYKNNFIIAAHNYRKHFGSLDELEAGDEVYFKDMAGNEFTYEVMYTEIIDNNDIVGMSSGDWDLTLFTCTYGGATRVTVRCRLK